MRAESRSPSAARCSAGGGGGGGGGAVEAGGDERRDRGRDGHAGEVADGRPAPVVTAPQGAVVDEHGDELLDEQGVTLGGVADAAADGGGEGGLAEELLGEALAFDPPERLGEGG